MSKDLKKDLVESMNRYGKHVWSSDEKEQALWRWMQDVTTLMTQSQKQSDIKELKE
jgi:hypothetical protein